MPSLPTQSFNTIVANIVLKLWVGKLGMASAARSEEHTSELQSHSDLVCRLLLEKKKKIRRHCEYSLHYYEAEVDNDRVVCVNQRLWSAYRMDVMIPSCLYSNVRCYSAVEYIST